MTDLIEPAREYLSAGLAIIALEGKQPNSLLFRHGLKQALRGTPEGERDEELLHTLFTHPKTTGIGIVIEQPYVVVDIDGEEGAEQLAGILGTTALDRTPVARTSRGLHVWYGIAGEPQRTTKLGEKLDLKSVGGYVAVPPSLHPSGFRYEWLRPLVADGVIVPPIELPDALQELLTRQKALVEEYRPLRASNQPASLDALVRHVRHLSEGNRNNGLHWAASAAAQDGFPLAEAAPRLVEAAVHAGLDRDEAMTAIRSAYRRAR